MLGIDKNTSQYNREHQQPAPDFSEQPYRRRQTAMNNTWTKKYEREQT